jgi:RND family efflux transporter MFP subunit
VLNAEISVRRAEMELDALLVPASDVELADAEARVAQALENLEDLRAAPEKDDISSAEGQLEQARLALVQAEMNLTAAQQALEETTLVAPIDGTVMEVNATVGDKVGTTAMVRVAQMAQPQIQFWVQESDLNSVAAGNPVNVTFEALPDYSFSGHILSVDPALVQVGSTPAVQVWASVDLSANPVALLSGMNAEVEVVAAEARNAVLVPIGALRELDAGQYAVMVVDATGELEFRPVEIGVKGFVCAEVLSGLEVGETVSTGTTSTTSASVPSSEAAPAPAGGMMRILGG